MSNHHEHAHEIGNAARNGEAHKPRLHATQHQDHRSDQARSESDLDKQGPAISGSGPEFLQGPERSYPPDEADSDSHGRAINRARQKCGERGRNQGVDPRVIESLEACLPDNAPGETVIEGAGSEYADEGDSVDRGHAHQSRPIRRQDKGDHTYYRDQGSRPVEQAPDRVLHPAKGDTLHDPDYALQADAFR